MKPVITVTGLGKSYPVYSTYRGGYRNLREEISHTARHIFSRRTDSPQEEFWALKEINFEVHSGEVLGIVGRNGAGKSTLLKILSRITSPTEGHARIEGRVGALLEVGTGFHPELTGRENTFMNGKILGMKRAEILEKFDEIVAFSELQDFIDTPVKHYSSGMYVRLAFAVAAHLEQEILMVDEVLAVGDAGFQKKCIGKMDDIRKREGRTVLFVSHNMQAIVTLTQRCLVLGKGRILFDGPTEEAVSTYLSEGQTITRYTSIPAPDTPKITAVEIQTSLPDNTQEHGASMEFCFEVSTPFPLKGAAISFQVFNHFDLPIADMWLYDSHKSFCRRAGTYRLTCRIEKTRMFMGKYHLRVHFGELSTSRKFDTVDNVCPFEVVMYARPREYPWIPGSCTYIEDFEWYVEEQAGQTLMGSRG